MNNPGDSIIVELIVTNDFECTADTSIHELLYWKQPNVSFSVDDVCLGDTSFFIDETSPGDSLLQDWLWTINGGLFLDETNSSSEDPIYKFENCTENLDYFNLGLLLILIIVLIHILFIIFRYFVYLMYKLHLIQCVKMMSHLLILSLLMAIP